MTGIDYQITPKKIR